MEEQVDKRGEWQENQAENPYDLAETSDVVISK
jgi:hypothetical protein